MPNANNQARMLSHAGLIVAEKVKSCFYVEMSATDR